jgi:hypothetical protein
MHPELRMRSDSQQDIDVAMQARPNVYIELGMAFATSPRRTIIVEVGNMRPVAHLGGLNVVRFDGSDVAVGKVIQRLKVARCAVDDSGADWRARRRFADLDAYTRVAHEARTTVIT